MDCIICRYGEIALKGKNRGLFENRLVANMQDCLERNSIKGDVEKGNGRIFVSTKDEKGMSSLKDVFGLVSLSPAVVVDADKEKIRSAVADYVRGLGLKKGVSFRITTTRADKGIPFNSRDLNIFVGSFIETEFGLKVDLDRPEFEIGIEIRGPAYIFHEAVRCLGGIPLGMGGKVVCLVRTEADVAAAWLMMRRGCEPVIALLGKVDLSLMRKYGYGSSLVVKNIVSIDELDRLVQQNGCSAVVVGDTLDDFGPDKYSSLVSIVLHPLIAYSKRDVAALLGRIR